MTGAICRPPRRRWALAFYRCFRLEFPSSSARSRSNTTNTIIAMV